MKGTPSGSFSIRGRCILAFLLAFVFVVASVGERAHAGTAPPAQQAAEDSSNLAARAGKWIDIDLSSQTLRAYNGNKVIYATKVSTGTARYPTVTGSFKVYSKVRKQRMRGGTGKDRYDLPNVPHVMYFYRDYAIHGAYWHNNFGRPMSHGCVNLPLKAAEWLYNWTPIGTPVIVHR